MKGSFIHSTHVNFTRTRSSKSLVSSLTPFSPSYPQNLRVLVTTTGAGEVISGQIGKPKHQKLKQIQRLMRRNKITLLEEIQQLVWVQLFLVRWGSPVLGSGEQNCPFAVTVCVSVYLSVCLYCHGYYCVLWGVLRGVTQADTIWWTTPHELFSSLRFENS